MANIVNAIQMKAGAKVTPLYGNNLGNIYQPYQMLPQSEKTPTWCANVMDYIEWAGMRQLKRTSNKMLKNYKLANAQIEKSDYIIAESDYAEVIEPLIKEDVSALELKFYPIIPTVVDVLTNEFSKRYQRITFEMKDEKSANEMLDEKYKDVEDILTAKAEAKQAEAIQKLGIAPESDQAKQMMDPQTIKSLPQVQEFYTKDYRSLYSQWAEHQMQTDNDRFSMPELERQNFRNSLITDREFWHFLMGEDDYNVETWNPPQVFYRKSPNVRYMSDAAWIGHITLMTVPEVVDKYGWMMSQQQMESLNSLYPVRGAMYTQTGLGNESGAFYDPTMSYEWNTQGPGVAMRQFMSAYNTHKTNGDIVRWILDENEDLQDTDSAYLVRVSTIYWKTQRLMGHLSKKDEKGELFQDTVDETYKITDKPIYNTTVFKNKTKDNLEFGEHIDWFWMNETWGGYKIGPNIPGFIGMNNPSGFAPMYVGMTGGIPGRIKYQFKGNKSIWGCKLPVEGRVFNDYNTTSKALVDKMKPYQVSFNMVLNQIQDIQIDELGTIIVFDQRVLPKNSMGEDWGENNIQKAYLAAKNFSMIPIDTSILNTETAIQHLPFQRIDMSQHERIMSKIKQAQWIKEEALSSIGLNPQRMGTPIDKEITATGVEQAVNASYSQTEHFYIQHSDELMPKVHQMRTDLAQFYQSKNPSIRLQYVTKDDEKIMFLLNGNELIGRDINVICRTRIGMRNILENIKQMLLKDNTIKLPLWDKIRAIKADDMADLDTAITLMEMKDQKEKEAEQQAEQQQQQADQEHEMQMLQEKQQFEASENEKKIAGENYRAELNAASKAATAKPPQAGEDAYLNATKEERAASEHQDKMDLEREKLSTGNKLKMTDQQIQQQKIHEESKRTASDITVAKINKKKAEVEKKKK
jgi:hypothetical protein